MGQEKINQGEINKAAWKACDTFRGAIDSAQYKDYILVFLFLKYISDVWKDKKEQYEEQYKGDKERVKRKLERERFFIPDHATYDNIHSKKDASNIGEVINKALTDIEEHNKVKLENVFRNIDFNSEAILGETKERNRRLKHLIDDFSDPRLNFRPSKVGHLDIIGNVYQYLIEKFASDAGKKGGEFFTPETVSELIAKLIKPKSGDRICDPTCGSGSLLLKVAKEITDGNFSLYGQESNGGTWALCKMNMFVHDIDNARIEWGDTIGNPKLIEKDSLMKFNIIVANPPFSLEKWGVENAESDRYRRFHRGIPPQSKGDYAFITHMVETMTEDDDGRVAVIVPHGVLFRGSSEGKIRQKFIEENLLDAVVGLPASLFYGVGIPAAILIFKKKRKTTDILFIDASREFEKGTPQNKLRSEDIKKIAKTYENYKTVDRYAYRAAFEEIKGNEFNLNIPRYVDTFVEAEEIDLKKTEKEIESLEDELIGVRKEMQRYLKELGL